MLARLKLPHSPVHELQVFDPPSPIHNPWEDLSSWVPADEEEEQDYGGGERDDDEDDDDDDE
jgi:hypothetical protein